MKGRARNEWDVKQEKNKVKKLELNQIIREWTNKNIRNLEIMSEHSEQLYTNKFWKIMQYL